MKTKIELETIFSDIQSNSKSYSKGLNWEVAIFKPFVNDKNVIRYNFRLYGKMSNSRFVQFNENLQYCADVYYYFDNITNMLTRELNIKHLDPIILCHIDIEEIVKAI
jgi:hypothetical protein